jgi:hypothetical protein
LAALHSVLADPKEFQRLNEDFQTRGGSLGARLKKLGSYIVNSREELWVAEKQYAVPSRTAQRIPLLRLVGIRPADRFGRGIAPVVEVRATTRMNFERFAINEPVVLFHGRSMREM